MNELINICYENDAPTVLGRELHKVLEVKTAYKDWFPRMCAYGFSEGTDFNPLKFEQVQKEGERTVKRELIDHQLTLDMAKELCMLQRNDIGKKFRQYFIEVEKAWNTPEAVMARALQMAQQQLLTVQEQNRRLLDTVAVQRQQISELQPKAGYYDIVLQCKDLLPISVIAKDYGKSAVWMNGFLREHGVQYKQGDIWLLYQKYAQRGYTSTKTHTVTGSEGGNHVKVHTYWTQAGRLFIYDLMKSAGHFPIMEQLHIDD